MQTHGSATWRAEGRILFCVMEGPFNQEAITGMENDLNHFPVTSDGKDWGVVCEAKGDSLFTPEAEAAFSEFLIKVRDDKCCAVAYALSGMPWPRVFKQQIERIYASRGIQLYLVAEKDEAVRLVQDALASCGPEIYDTSPRSL